MILHRLWLGPRPVPPEYSRYGSAWATMNPRHTVVLWTQATLPRMRNQDVLDDLVARDGGRKGIELYVQMADVIGYELVHRFGGVYLNMDIQPVRPIDRLYTEAGLEGKAWACWEDSEKLVNAVLGGPAEHPFWDAVIQALPERYRAYGPGTEMVFSTGPHLLTSVYHALGGDRNPDFVGLPAHTFNPVHWDQVPAGGDASALFDWSNPPAGVYGVHHWGHKRDGRSNVVETATQ